MFSILPTLSCISSSHVAKRNRLELENSRPWPCTPFRQGILLVHCCTYLVVARPSCKYCGRRRARDPKYGRSFPSIWEKRLGRDNLGRRCRLCWFDPAPGTGLTRRLGVFFKFSGWPSPHPLGPGPAGQTHRLRCRNLLTSVAAAKQKTIK